jgi:hypothetical protein
METFTETGVTGIVTDLEVSFPPASEPRPNPFPNPSANPEAVMFFLSPECVIGFERNSAVGELAKTGDADGLALLGGVAAKLVEKKALDLELAACVRVGVLEVVPCLGPGPGD